MKLFNTFQPYNPVSMMLLGGNIVRWSVLMVQPDPLQFNTNKTLITQPSTLIFTTKTLSN